MSAAAELERRRRHEALDLGAMLREDELEAMTRSTDIGLAPARAAARELLGGRPLLERADRWQDIDLELREELEQLLGGAREQLEALELPRTDGAARRARLERRKRLEALEALRQLVKAASEVYP